MLHLLSPDTRAYAKSHHREALNSFLVIYRWTPYHDFPEEIDVKNITLDLDKSYKAWDTAKEIIAHEWNNRSNTDLTMVALNIANRWKNFTCQDKNSRRYTIVTTQTLIIRR